MVEKGQHQMNVRHAEEAAEKSIQAAQQAERQARKAAVESNPQLMQQARSRLDTVSRSVEDSAERLDGETNESQKQQVSLPMQELEQSAQSLEATQELTDMPRQIR